MNKNLLIGNAGKLLKCKIHVLINVYKEYF